MIRKYDKEKRKAYYEKHKEVDSIRRKEYYQKNKLRELELVHKRYLQNKDKINKRLKEYRKIWQLRALQY